MEVQIKDIKGKDTGKTLVLSDAVFGIEPNNHAIYLDVKQFLAHQRQGTHKAKERAEVSFSTKKLKKQKGTGGARAGSRKSPVFTGGGTIFGPRPRDYGFKLNKKLKTLARRSALSFKLKNNTLLVVQDFDLAAPSTKNFITILDGIAANSRRALFVLGENNKNVYLSSRNLQNAKVVTADDVNTYDVLNAETLILTEGSIKKIEEILS